MAQFLGVHDMGTAMADEDARGAWSRYKQACDANGCKALHVHYNADEGRSFCVTEADSAETVQKAHDDAELPLQEIIPVSLAE